MLGDRFIDQYSLIHKPLYNHKEFFYDMTISDYAINNFFLSFQNMEKPFMNSVRITLGDRFNDAIETVYHRTICFLLTNLERAFKNEKMDKVQLQ